MDYQKQESAKSVANKAKSSVTRKVIKHHLSVKPVVDKATKQMTSRFDGKK